MHRKKVKTLELRVQVHSEDSKEYKCSNKTKTETHRQAVLLSLAILLTHTHSFF